MKTPHRRTILDRPSVQAVTGQTMNRHQTDVAEQQFALAVATTTNAMRADLSACIEDVASDALFEAARDSWVYFTNEQPLDIRQLGTVAQVIKAVARDMVAA